MTMTAEKSTLDLTPRRRAALTLVRDGRVEYCVPTADYMVDGVAVGGWDRRTFSDLQRAKLIDFSGERGSRPLGLTKQGERALDAGTDKADGTSANATP